MTCSTCGKTAEKLKRLLAGDRWECSHVECPKRRRAPELDHHDHQQHLGGYAEVPHDHAAGCYRAKPTCKD